MRLLKAWSLGLRSQAHMHTCTYAQYSTHTCTQAHMRTYAYAQYSTHTCTIKEEMNRRLETQTKTAVQRLVHTYTHVHMHAYTHAHIHTHPHAHIHTCTHTHMHNIGGHDIACWACQERWPYSLCTCIHSPIHTSVHAQPRRR